ncbi:hypothetical protein CROQUDRAFT_101782 [Cronartium quercuum f. sp. fusiforme G11]|uniref:Pentatricopeptide repeat-containing protein n=1 Tax=Cronartium quercuum f. sp. fusiforme G11 TaxID=708437 RepID=A0A9P6T502_9BASI|nr:hypothetical protein CROQUDRAFT_101782 [Cronartium quercuum f. sp. fusiforme G11]
MNSSFASTSTSNYSRRCIVKSKLTIISISTSAQTTPITITRPRTTIHQHFQFQSSSQPSFYFSNQQRSFSTYQQPTTNYPNNYQPPSLPFTPSSPIASSTLSWWQQSSPAPQPDPPPSPTFHPQFFASSFASSSRSLSRAEAQTAYRHHLNTHPDPITTLLLPADNGGILPICEIIWSHLQPGESLESVIELQRLSIEDLLRYAHTRQSSLAHSARHALILDTFLFISASSISSKILTTLGLDPIKGWRNLVREPIRIKMLHQLLDLLQQLNITPSDWWESLHFQHLNNSLNLDLSQVERLGLTLIIALAKQGSPYQSLRLFRSMHRLLPVERPHPFLTDDDQPLNSPTSANYKAAIGLSLVDALIHKKRLNEADEVMRKLTSRTKFHSLYQRLLLTNLSIKSALGDICQVEIIGQTYLSIWRDSNELNLSLNAKNVRRRNVLRQHPRFTVARAKIEALSVSGRVAEAEEVFRKTLVEGSSKDDEPMSALDQLAIADLYAEMMKAHVAVDGVEAAQTLADELDRTMTDERHFNLLLQAYAARADLGKCADVLEQMKATCLGADMHLYANVCVAFANIREPESVLKLIELVMERGWEPKRELWNILLDSYVEASDWPRAARLLAFLELDDGRRAREPDVVTKGIILKALVLSGAPTDEVVESFKAMYNERSSTGPADTRAYTLLLQSVCDAGMMDLAEAIFFSLKEHAPSGVEPNVFMYGIMICAFLRLGKKSLAQFYFQDMRLYGLRPSSIIYSMITTAYARSSGATVAWDGEGPVRDGITLAREMVERFKQEMAADGLAFEPDSRSIDLPDPETALEPIRHSSPYHRRRRSVAYDLPSVRHQTSHRLLAPIIQSYVKSARPAKALEVVKELVEGLGCSDAPTPKLGQTVELDVYTMLLDGYRRAGDPAGVMEIWRRIFNEALESGKSDGGLGAARARLFLAISDLSPGSHSKLESVEGNRPRNHILCLPLSIYTDALASHGFHREVTDAWEAVQAAGFAFDPANFNHLCVASFKSGNSRLAWEIVEHVLFGEGEVEAEVDKSVTPESESQDGDWLLGSSSVAGGGHQWPKFLRASVARRRPRPTLEGSEEFGKRALVSAEERDGPGRPPNRTSVRKAQRFDDQVAARGALESLLASLREPAPGESSEQVSIEIGWRGMGSGGGWSEQVEAIGRARRLLAWKPYGKVLRMLHGSMWRECSDVVMRRLEVSGHDHESGTMEEAVQGIVESYGRRYPKSIRAVFVHALGDRAGGWAGDEEWVKWAMRDMVVRVIGRTKERVRGSVGGIGRGDMVV